MNDSEPKHRWKLIAAGVLTAIIATLLFARLFPWLALLTGLLALIAGIAYTAWPPISEKLAGLRNLPRPPLQSRIYIGAPIVLFGIVLLFLAQSQIRVNWRTAAIRQEVAQGITDANAALDEERVDDALAICSRLDKVANSEEKAQVGAVRARAKGIQDKDREKAADREVARLVSDGRYKLIVGDLAAAGLALQSALDVPAAKEFGPATTFANDIVAAYIKSATRLLDNGDSQNGKEQVEHALRVPTATDLTEAKWLHSDICNQEVKECVAQAHVLLNENKRDEAAAELEKALGISGATEIAAAQQMLSSIQQARQQDANAKVSALMAEAQQAVDAKRFDDAIKALNSALVFPHSSQKQQVTAAIQDARRKKTAEKERIAAVARAEEKRRADEADRIRRQQAAAEAARKAAEEYEQNGLVLLRKTVQGTSGGLLGRITGTVINRRSRKLTYAQITFNLYDDSGAQVGTAMANINGLEPGGRWKFDATTFGKEFLQYKVNELTGF